MPLTRYQHIKIAIVVTLGMLFLWLFVDTFFLPPVFHLRYVTPTTTAYMRQYEGPKEIAHAVVPLSAISPLLRQAVVLAEDDQFFEHRGLDWEAIKDAIRINLRRGRLSRGASTITMQLARNLFLSPSKTPFRKFKEALIAMKMEQVLSKERILELYLNSVEWGDGIFGAQAAAKHYFGVSAADLGKHEAAFLAAILPRPRFYDRHRGGAYLARRIATIESRL